MILLTVKGGFPLTPAKRKEIRHRHEIDQRRRKEERTGQPVPPKKKYAKNTNKR